MGRRGRPSWMRMFVELPLRFIFMLIAFLIRVLIVVRRVVPASLLILLLALIPVILFARSRLDDFGDWLLIGAALMLAFASGALFHRR